MDRLPALAAIALAAVACGKDSPAPTPSRVEGAKVRLNHGTSTAAFCDVHAADDSRPGPVLPPLDGPPLAAQAPGHWRWLNVWATWCKPCVEELPRIARWRQKLPALDFTLVSVDENDADIAAFRQAHPDTPESARLADPGKQTDWFKQLGLDAGSPIPIHVFVAPSGHIRCARAGGLREQDFAAVERLFAE